MTTITIPRAVVEQVLEALESCDAAHPSDGGRQWYDDKLVEPAITALRAALAEPDACTWYGDEEGTFETTCGHLFQMIDGTPTENRFKHCCFCGKALVEGTEDE